MADDSSLNDTDHSVQGAANAIEALLKGPSTEESPQETPQDSPQAGADERPEVGNTEDEPLEASSETTATEAEIEPAKRAPTSSPDLETRLQEASKSKQETDTARNQLLTQLSTLNAVVPQMQAAIQGEFADIKNIDDLENVARTDPERYNRFVFQQARLNQAQQAQRNAQDVLTRERNDQARKAWADEQAKLHKLMPDLADPVKGSAIAKKLQDYAQKNGIKAERLSNYTADEFVALNKSMQFDNLQQAQAAAKQKAASAPPVQKPGVARSTGDKSEKIRGDFERLQKSGHINDAAAVFRNLLN